MVSAVPAGDVMARDDVLGHSMPCAATMGTTSMEVRLPGMPPMQCLSTTELGVPIEPPAHGDHGVGEEVTPLRGPARPGCRRPRRPSSSIFGVAVLGDVTHDGA